MSGKYWEQSPFAEDSIFHPNWDKKQQTKLTRLYGKKQINLLIVLDASGKSQFDDTKNTIWDVYHTLSLANYEMVKDLITKFSFKNFCLVHHGNTYSTAEIPKSQRAILGVNNIKDIEQLILQFGDSLFIDVNEEYFNSLHEKSKQLFMNEETKVLGYPVDTIKAFFSLRALISNIESGGNYFSVACDEADDKNFLKIIQPYASKNVKLFANSNYSTIRTSSDLVYEGKKIPFYGSILNYFLTRPKDWLDDSGWQYFDNAKNELIITQKDLWLFSKNKTKVYELVARKKELTQLQLRKEMYAQRFFSKNFELWYKKEFGKSKYDNYVTGILQTYPEFNK
jgi:hypothetical protein